MAFNASDYHHMLVWLGAAAGPVIATADWRRWSFPRTWFIPLVGWALVVAMTWPVIAGREIDFSVAAAKTMIGVQGIFAAPPPVAAAFVVIFAIGQLLSILWLDMCFARFGRADAAAFVRVVIVPFLVSAMIGAVVGMYQALGDIRWLNPEIWSTANRATGLMLDANTFGTGAAIWAPAAIAAAWAVGRQLWPGLLAFALLAAALSMSGSRTALLTLSAGGCGLVIGALRRHGMWQPRIGRLVALVAVALLVLVDGYRSAQLRKFERPGPVVRTRAAARGGRAAAICGRVVDAIRLRPGGIGDDSRTSAHGHRCGRLPRHGSRLYFSCERWLSSRRVGQCAELVAASGRRARCRRRATLDLPVADRFLAAGPRA